MQALVITAYTDIQQLRFLLDQAKNHFKLFIHIDRKSDIKVSDIADVLGENSDAVILKKYSIPWGGYAHLQAIIDLLGFAAEQDDIDYVHIISGQTILVRPIDDFAAFPKENKIYMGCTRIQDTSAVIQNRFKHYHSFVNAGPKNVLVRIPNAAIAIIQDLFNMQCSSIGPYGFNDVYKGLIWMSMPIEAAKYVLDFIKNNETFMHDLKHRSVPEEFCFQTILMNSDFRDDVVRNSLQYGRWSGRKPPAYLDESDYPKIIESGSFFARKIDSSSSAGLIEAIQSGL